MIYKTFTFDIRSSKLEDEIAYLVRRTTVGLTRFFKCRLKQTPYVFLLHSRADLERVWRKKSKRWMIACAKNGNIFVLHPKKIPTESSHADADKHYFLKVVKHEVVHLYSMMFIDRTYPRWLREGLSCYFAGQGKYVLSAKQMLSIFKCVSPPVNDYVLGCNWIKLLIDEFGKKKLSAFIISLKGERYSKKKFDELFFAVYGFHFKKEEFERFF